MTDRASAAVFVSYAREDSDAARRIAEALRSHGLEVWFDQDELRGGDAWDQKLRRQIKECALFLPVVSANTQERREGYFRLEWKLAAERTHLMAEGVPFIAPVVIDATTEANALVPAEFMRVQWTRLPGAKVTPEFAGQVKRLLGPVEVARVSRPVGAPKPDTGQETRATPNRSVPMWALAAVALCAVALGAAFLHNRKPEPAAAPPQPVAPVVSDKSIAVLPFENRSADNENVFFTVGIHDDITTHLTRISDLHVVSRTSVMAYSGTQKKIPQIARELGVAFVLEGSVQRSGTTVRITGRLTRAATDQQVWANHYDRDLTAANIFAIQSELAKAIAGELKVAVLPQETQLIDRRPTASLDAYDCFLKAKELRDRRPSGWLLDAEKLLERAVEIDPRFGLAWAQLAWVKTYGYSLGRDDTGKRVAAAREAVKKAEKLMPDSPEFFLCRGWVRYSADTDYVGALKDMERAKELSPNFGEPPYAMAMVLRRQGRWLDALQSLRNAQRIEPANGEYVQQSAVLLLAGRRYAEAEIDLRRADAFGRTQNNASDIILGLFSRGDLLRATPISQLPPPVRRDFALLRGEAPASTGLAQQVDEALVQAMRGEREAVRAMLEEPAGTLRQQIEKDAAAPGPWSTLAVVEALRGNRDEALRCARKAEELAETSPDYWEVRNSNTSLVFVHAWTGDSASAINELARKLRVVSFPNISKINVHTLRLHPAFFPLRGDPRFEALLNDPKNNAPLF